MSYFKFKPMTQDFVECSSLPEHIDRLQQLCDHYGGQLMIPSREHARLKWFGFYDMMYDRSYSTMEEWEQEVLTEMGYNDQRMLQNAY